MNNQIPNKTPRLLRISAIDRPLLVFLLLTFGWSWSLWLAAFPLRESQPLLVMAIVFIGGYGPAAGAVLTAWLRTEPKPDISARRLAIISAASVVIFALFTGRYFVGSISNYDRLPADLTLTWPVVACTALASLAGGWVISAAWSRHRGVRETMKTLLPAGLHPVWALAGGFFFAALLLTSWGLAVVLGLPVEVPAVWAHPAPRVAGLFLLAFSLTALARGGMEEPGWRGFMQPLLQEKRSPLAAAVIVSLFWSLWHLPLFLNGFYAEDILAGMLGGGLYRILLAVVLAWFYNKSGGSIFLMVVMHTTFNLMVNYIPFSESILAILLLAAVVVMVVEGRMWRKPADRVRT